MYIDTQIMIDNRQRVLQIPSEQISVTEILGAQKIYTQITDKGYTDNDR